MRRTYNRRPVRRGYQGKAKETFPRDANLDREVREAVDFWTVLANEMYNCDMKTPAVRYDLRGTTAGQAFGNLNLLRINTVLLEENVRDFIDQTVPHEVAHLVVRKRFGNRTAWGQKVMPHGFEWQQVMKDFGLTPDVTHDYDVSNSTVRTLPREFVYTCGCQDFFLTKILHNKIQSGRNRVCPKCKGRLVYKGRKENE